MRYKGHVLYQATPALQERPEDYVFEHIHNHMFSLYSERMKENSLQENDGFCVSFAATTDDPLKIEHGKPEPLPTCFKELAKKNIPTNEMRTALFGYFHDTTTSFRVYAYSDEGKALNIFPEKHYPHTPSFVI